MMSPVAHHREFTPQPTMHEPTEHQVIYIDRPPERGHGMLAVMFAGLVASLIRFVIWCAVAALVLVTLFVGGLWVVGKGVEHLPDTGTTTTTGP